MTTSEEMERYYTAFGRFMHLFARAEVDLTSQVLHFALTLWGDSEVRPLPILRALIAGQRYAGAKDTLKRILRTSNASPETVKAIEQIFDQFGQIHRMRDMLAHYSGRHVEGDTYEVSRVLNSREDPNEPDVRFTLQTLANMSRDLGVIPTRLTWALHPYLWEQAKASRETDDYRADVLGPWRYKPS